MSSQPFTLRIRMGNNEVELSGSQEDVLKTLDNLPEIIGKVSGAFGNVPETIKVESKRVESEVEGYPTVAIPSETSCPDAIVRILSTEWAKKKPKNLNELLEAMKVNAIYYPLGTVKGRLTDLTKKGVLRRIKSSDGYGYILVKQE